MAKLKITKTFTNPAGSGQASVFGSTQIVDRYTMPTQIPAGTYVGGTGGFTTQTGRQIRPTVKVGTATATLGSIVAQKGAHKFQVADQNTVQDEDIVAGKEYRISSVSGTNWDQFGAGVNANTNDIFTAKINGSAAAVDNGTVQNVSTCTLVNLATPTAANTMSIVCTACNINNANIANIGANVSGNRITAYLTWNAGDIATSAANFKVGQTINLANSNLTGNVILTAINGAANLTITTDTNQAISANTTGFTSTFFASKISNKYVWDFLNGGTAESSSTGGFTGSTNPNRYRYHLASETDTFVLVAYA